MVLSPFFYSVFVFNASLIVCHVDCVYRYFQNRYYFLKDYINFVCARAHVCYGMPVEVRVHPVRACPLLLPHGSWGLNLSHWAWGQAAFPTEPSLQPSKLLFRLACLIWRRAIIYNVISRHSGGLGVPLRTELERWPLAISCSGPRCPPALAFSAATVVWAG